MNTSSAILLSVCAWSVSIYMRWWAFIATGPGPRVNGPPEGVLMSVLRRLALATALGFSLSLLAPAPAAFAAPPTIAGSEQGRPPRPTPPPRDDDEDLGPKCRDQAAFMKCQNKCPKNDLYCPGRCARQYCR